MSGLEKSWAKRALLSRGYLDFLEKRPPGSLPPEPDDLWYLYRLVRRQKPRTIVEFGSGCSTMFLAQAVFCTPWISAKSGLRLPDRACRTDSMVFMKSVIRP